MKPRPYDFAILGAGISGLALALELQRLGKKVVVLEQETQSGGVLRSVHKENFTWDRAAHTLAVDENLKTFFKAYNVDSLLIKPGDVAKVRKIVIHDKIWEITNHPTKILKAKFLSLGAKLYLLKELFKRPIGLKNPTVYQFFHYHFGEEITKNIISAVFAGIYAGDIEQMEMKSVMAKVFEIEQSSGSLIRGLIKNKEKFAARQVYGVKGGMERLCSHLADQVSNLFYNAEVTGIVRKNEVFEISFDESTIECVQFISTIPSYRIAPLLSEIHPILCNKLKMINYEPMVLIHVGYDEGVVAETNKAFGFLCGQYASPVLKGAIFNSDLFPDRAPAKGKSYTIFMKPELAWLDDEEKLNIKVEETIAHFATLTYIKSDPRTVQKTVWKNAIPQFNIPYAELKAEILNHSKSVNGLHLSGSYISGVSVPDCINFNRRLAQSLSEH